MIFYDILYEAIDMTVPKMGQFKNKFPSWYTDERYIFLKKALHKTWKTTGDINIYIEFKKTRDLCIRLSRQAHKQYHQHVQSLTKTNLREFWKHINSRRK